MKNNIDELKAKIFEIILDYEEEFEDFIVTSELSQIKCLTMHSDMKFRTEPRILKKRITKKILI